MGKSTHFIGQPMYNQALKLLDKSKIFESVVKKAENAIQNGSTGGLI